MFKTPSRVNTYNGEKTFYHTGYNYTQGIITSQPDAITNSSLFNFLSQSSMSYFMLVSPAFQSFISWIINLLHNTEFRVLRS